MMPVPSNTSLPATPPTTPPSSALSDAEEIELLLTFVRNRNVHCPRCDYNLRALTKPVCPECQEPLRLSVGMGRPKFGWLIAALAPGIFSGIAAFFLGGMIVMVNISPTGKMPPQLYVVDAFGWLSAICTAVLFFHRYWFLRQNFDLQMMMAGVIWLVHVGFFFTMWALLK